MGMSEKIPFIAGGAVIVVIVGIIVLVAVSLKKLDSQDVALKYDTIQKYLDETPFYEGLHSGPPGFDFIKFPSVYRTFNFENLKCLNKDGVNIRLSVSYQYRIKASDIYIVAKQFKNFEGFQAILRNAGESALMDSCSLFNTSQFQSERGLFQEDIRRRTVAKYNEISCDVTDLQVNNIARPGQYESAIRAKESAREDIEVALQERPRRLTEAETNLRESETLAGITVNKALSDARVIENLADNEAKAILNDYTKEAETYKNIKQSLNLDVPAFLSYIGTRTIEAASEKVYIGMDSPAKTSYFP